MDIAVVHLVIVAFMFALLFAVSFVCCCRRRRRCCSVSFVVVSRDLWMVPLHSKFEITRCPFSLSACVSSHTHRPSVWAGCLPLSLGLFRFECYLEPI